MLLSFLLAISLGLQGAIRAEDNPAVPSETVLKHDFGKIPMCREWEGEYLLRNDSEEPWSVSDIEVSCGCLEVRADSTQVMPGEDVLVYLKLNLQNRFGRVSESAKLTLTLPGRSLEGIRYVKIHVSGEILPEVIWSPATLTVTDLKPSEERVVQVAAMFRQPGQKLIPASQTDSSDGPLGRHASLKVVRNSNGANVFVTIRDEDLPKGRAQGSFEIPFRLSKGEGITSLLRVTWTRRSPFTTSPGFLMAQGPIDGNNGGFSMPPVEVRRLDRRPFRIFSIQPSDDCLSVQDSEGNQSAVSHVLSLTVNPKLKIFPSCTLTVVTDDPWFSAIEIPLVPGR